MRVAIRPPSPALTVAFTLTALALCACEQGKPRHPPPDPMAAGPPPVEDAPMPKALSEHLLKRSDPAGWFLDHIGAAYDPANKPPAVTPRDRPVLLDGFAYNAVAKTPGRGVDVAVDGKPYGTVYGAPRADVARAFKTPALLHVGFRTVLPTGTLSAGPHKATVRVIADDDKTYYESPPVAFTVQ